MTASRSAGGREEAGFSFVELLVALAIMAFAFTYGVIHLDGATAPTKLASAGRQMGAQIEFLRGHAIQASRPVEIRFSCPAFGGGDSVASAASLNSTAAVWAVVDTALPPPVHPAMSDVSSRVEE